MADTCEARMEKTIASLKDSSSNVIGNKTRVKVVKNKMAPPFKVVEFDILYGEGISKIGEIIDIGNELGIINKSGSWFSYNGNKIAQGRDATKEFLVNNPDICNEIEQQIRSKIHSNNIKKIDKTYENEEDNDDNDELDDNDEI